MIVLISPTKNMKIVQKTEGTLAIPPFVEKTGQIIDKLKSFSVQEVQHLMKINDKLAMLNKTRYQNFEMDAEGTAAIDTYDGLQFKNIAADDFTEEEKAFAEQKLRIISGMYGYLTPYSSIYPYRLEFQTKMSVGEAKNLYQFWDSLIYETLKKEDDVMINLTSNEYSKAILPYVDEDVTFINCAFKVRKKGELKVEATASKMARGKITRFIIKNKIDNPKELKKFAEDGFCYSEEHSTATEYVFIKE